MIAIDVESLTAPISSDAPSGQNLEYDPDFAEMERAAQGTPEQQYGSTIIEGKEPEWEEVAKAARGLLSRTHDLRIALYLARSSLKSSGWQAFRDSLNVLRSYVTDYWESVHPQLDPDDDLDPTTRVNTIATLCDNGAMLNLLRTVPVVSSRAAGQFSHRDIGYATGEVPYTGPADAKPKMSLIDAAFADCDLDQLKKNTQALTDAVDYVKEIEKALTKQVGAGNSRSLDPAVKELDAIRKLLLERLNRRGGSLNTEAPAAAANDVDVDVVNDFDGEIDAGAGGGRGAARAVRRDWNDDIDCRDDAIKAIEKVIQYFERFEPSSPLPLLLRRAMRLSTKSFLEILRDISPDGLSQAETLGGMSSEEYTQMAAASAAAAAAKPSAAKSAAAPAPPPPPPPPPPPSSSSFDY